MLRQIAVPNVTKFVVTTGKFDAHKEARAFNIEADYPAEPALLQTLAMEAGGSDLRDQRFRDGYDLFCLRRILEVHDGFDFALLLREADGFDDRWLELRSSIRDKLFLTFVQPRPERDELNSVTNLLIDLRDKRAAAFLDRVGMIYASGAAYAMTRYSLEEALSLAWNSLGLEEMIAQRQQATRMPEASGRNSFAGPPTGPRSEPFVGPAAFVR
jgi:hypothetical protein